MRIALPASFVFTWFALLAQLSAPAPSFEVASIRPVEIVGSVGGEFSMAGVKTEPGTLTMRNVTLRTCILWAWDLKPYQLSAPAWLGDARFDIAAKAGDAASDDRLRLMLRALLLERFGLKVHHEGKELAVYLLTVMKSGPKFHESTTEGPALFREEKNGLVAERAFMSELALQISQPLNRPVIDRTGLKGRYDIRVDITLT